MTIAFGLIYQSKNSPHEGLLFASDSRGSTGSHVADAEQKVVSIQFPGYAVLIAKAGDAGTANAFDEELRQIARKAKITSPNSIRDAAERAIRKVKKRLLTGYSGDTDQRLAENDCGFVIGYFHKGLPYIYTLCLTTGLASGSLNQKIAVIGNPMELVRFLLIGIDLSNLQRPAEFAASVVEMCKLHDPACGGPCQIMVLSGAAPQRPLLHVPVVAIPQLVDKMLRQSVAHNYLLKRFATGFFERKNVKR